MEHLILLLQPQYLPIGVTVNMLNVNMEKHVLSEQTGFLSGQNLSLAGQLTCLLTKNIYRLVSVYFNTLHKCKFNNYYLHGCNFCH